MISSEALTNILISGNNHLNINNSLNSNNTVSKASRTLHEAVNLEEMATLLEEEGDIVANSSPFATVYLNSNSSKELGVQEVEDSKALHATVDNLTGKAMQHVSMVQLSTLLLNPKTKVSQRKPSKTPTTRKKSTTKTKASSTANLTRAFGDCQPPQVPSQLWKKTSSSQSWTKPIIIHSPASIHSNLTVSTHTHQHRAPGGKLTKPKPCSSFKQGYDALLGAPARSTDADIVATYFQEVD